MSASPEQRENRLGISPVQVAGSALAAASAAFLASFFGVTGTIIGAAVASVVATVASATYTSSLRHSGAAVRRTAQALSRPHTPDQPEPTVQLDPQTAPSGGRLRSAPHRLPPAKVAAATVVVLVITFGALTGFEALTGRPLSALVTGRQESGTSLGRVDRSSSSDPTPAPTPSRAASPSATPSSSPTAQPTPTATPSATPSPSATPGAGSTSTPQATPSTGASALPSTGATSIPQGLTGQQGR